MAIYWDQIFVAPVRERLPAARIGAAQPEAFRATPLDLRDAELLPRGCMLEFSPDGRAPTLYDYDRLSPAPTRQPAGRMTRFGDVTDLLRAGDDRFVILGPGDELSVRFNAASLPELSAGWVRSFVLQTRGYCKDCALFTAHSDTVEPLPFRGMSNYPYPASEHYPADLSHRDYLRRYNTRVVDRANPKTK
jgi:hypothetical protein